MSTIARQLVAHQPQPFIAPLLQMTNALFSHRNIAVLGVEQQVPVTETLSKLGYQIFRVRTHDNNDRLIYEGPIDVFKLPNSTAELEEAAGRLYKKVDQHLQVVRSRKFIVSPRGTKVDPVLLSKSKLDMDRSGALTLDGRLVQRMYPCCSVSDKDQMPFSSESTIRAIPRFKDESQIEFFDEQNLSDQFSQIAILRKEEGRPILTLATLNTLRPSDPEMRSRMEEYRSVFKTLAP